MNNLKFIANFNKKFSKFINNLLEKNLNKLNADNFKNILINNKIFLSIVALIILFLSYLSFPNIHNKEELALEIKKNLKNKLNLEFNFQEDLDLTPDETFLDTDKTPTLAETDETLEAPGEIDALLPPFSASVKPVPKPKVKLAEN